MRKNTRSSYSSITLYERCGAAHYYRYDERIPSVTGVAAQRGKRLHTAAERFLNGEIDADHLPVEFWRLKEWIVMLKAAGAQTEKIVRINDAWELCPEDSESWIVIIDIVYFDPSTKTIYIFDLKSGKAYDSHADQLQLYATVMLATHAQYDAVEVAAVYLDTGQQLYQTRYTRETLPELRKTWAARRAKEQSGDRRPNPSFYACRFCSYAASRGGPCENEFVGEPA